MRHSYLITLLGSLLVSLIAGAFWVLTQVFPEATHTVIAQTFQASDIALVYQIITAVFLAASIILILIVVIILFDKFQTFIAEIVGKDRFLLGETMHFKAQFKGQLKRGLFICRVRLPNGKIVWWPAFDTFRHTKAGDLGILSGRKTHKAEWNVRIPKKYPTGKYEAQIGVWDRVAGSDNKPVKERSVSFWVLDHRISWIDGTGIISSGDTGFVIQH